MSLITKITDRIDGHTYLTLALVAFMAFCIWRQVPIPEWVYILIAGGSPGLVFKSKATATLEKVAEAVTPPEPK